MGLLTRSVAEFRETLANPSRWLVLAFGGGQQTAAGILVNEGIALRSTTVMACVRIISETIAQLPLVMYRRLPRGGKDRASEHPLYSILHDQTNSEMTAFEFREVLQAHLLTWGNAYAEIERDNDGRVRGLWPLLPDRTWPYRDHIDGRIKYRTRIKRDPMSVGLDDTLTIVLDEERVLHVKGLGFDGLKGYGVIQYARELVAQDLALNEFAGRFFGNGAVPGGVLQTDKKLTKEQHDRIRVSWQEQHQGLTNAQRVAILEEGLKWQEIGIPLKDAQWIDARKYTRSEITSLFRIPPHMVGDVERSTSWGSGIEQQAIGFLVYTILPWTIRWEQALIAKLLGTTERAQFFPEFLVDGLVRGDIATRTAAYKAGVENGWLSPNDVREAENRNAYEGGDLHFIPLNFQTVEALGSASPQSALPAGALPKALPAPEDTEPSAASVPEVTELRSAMAEAQRHVIQEALERSLRRERADIPRGLERREDLEERSAWLGAFYQEHRAFVARALLAPVLSYAECLRALVVRELGRDVRPSSDLWRFVRDYAEGAAERYCAAALEAAADGPEISLEARGADMDALARAESQRAGNAIALALYRDAGETRKRWMLGCSDEECRALAQAGPIAADDRFGGKVLHPPLHEGCACLVVAVASELDGASRKIALEMARLTEARALGTGRSDGQPAVSVTIAEGAIRSEFHHHEAEPADLEIQGPGGRMTMTRKPKRA